MSRFSTHNLLCGFLVAGTLLAAADASAATIRIKDQATVTGSIIRLGDVADIADRDAKNREMLAKIELGPAPPTGTDSRLDYAAIRSRLKSVGVDMSQLNFAGRSIVRISRSATTPSNIQQTSFTPIRRRTVVPPWQEQRAEKLLTEAISQYLRRREPDLGGVNVSVEIEPDDVADVIAAARNEYDIRDGRKPWIGSQDLTVVFLDRDEKLHKVKIGCTISRKPLVWAARYPLRRGQTIQVTDLVRKQVDEIGDGFTEIEQLVGQETSRPISRDAVIKAREIRRRILVRSNDRLTVISRRGSLVVSRIMKARRAGAYGDMIPVVDLSGHGEVTVRVTGQFRAEIATAAPNRLAVMRDESGTIEFRKPTDKEPSQQTATTATRSAVRDTAETEWRRLDDNTTPRAGFRDRNVTPAGSTRYSNRRQLVTPPIPGR